mgnify:FL=1
MTLAALALCYMSAPLWLARLAVLEENPFQADSIFFVVIFFLVVLPLINALSDWCSVSLTQYCLGRYKQRQTNWLLWLGIDLLMAVLMLLVVFVCVFASLHLMAAWGWQLGDAKSVLAHFKGQPFAPENRWLICLVLTNLLPTLIHLLLVAAAQMAGWFFAVAKNSDALVARAERARELSPQEKEACNDCDYTWSEVEASDVAEYVVGMPVIWGLLVLSLSCPFFYCAYLAVTQGLHYLAVTLM